VGFELREHTADVAVEATGQDLGEAFAAVADGLAAAMCDSVPETGNHRQTTVTAENREALLFDYLDRLIYERDTDRVLPVDNTATVEVANAESAAWRVTATYRGVSLDAITAREVKAVTYSEMALSETPAGWKAYVVFDV
jgi:Uncharacterized conserved protein